MRKSLLELIKKTVAFEYELPNKDKNIKQIHFSTANDNCYSLNNETDLVSIIYNSIIEYSYTELNENPNFYQNMHTAALKNKMKYLSEDDTEVKYGFFGEVLLYTFLYAIYSVDSFVSRGIFFNPLEDSETKGYDSYHLIENQGQIELWFGEAKFHRSHNTAIRSVMDNIDKALSDKYLSKNFLAIENHINDIKPNGDIIKKVLNKWRYEGINILDELKQNNIKLVYPIFLIYQSNKQGYDSNIEKVVTYISDKYAAPNATLSIPCSIFFILLPIEDVNKTKKEVLEWINIKQQVLQ